MTTGATLPAATTEGETGRETRAEREGEGVQADPDQEREASTVTQGDHQSAQEVDTQAVRTLADVMLGLARHQGQALSHLVCNSRKALQQKTRMAKVTFMMSL